MVIKMASPFTLQSILSPMPMSRMPLTHKSYTTLARESLTRIKHMAIDAWQEECRRAQSRTGPAVGPGKLVIPATVSHIDKQLDQSVQAYHQQGLPGYYQILVLDGIVMTRKTEVGSQRGPAGGPGD